MNKNEALKLALEALISAYQGKDKTNQVTDAINVLRLVIDAENISSKPVAWEQFYPEMGSPKLAYLSPTESPDNACYTPPQRTWVGLTNDEVNNIAAGCHFGNSVQDAIFRAEQIIKEKNT